MLQGWKTYITAFLIVAATLAWHFGAMDASTYAMVMGILNGAGFAALRAGMK